ncbi:hypothetical protein IEQ34_019401 [Dendrobium chrysotoxum]|uniref:Uncharacterized protein n=1 Tax=Dendrobium chrysotoxum TaxID=161865 RepID=A0AAV7G9B6_DENCH|nr:hypothetical protein IEQ34_019401 [Dendrobium chrysotoxum]
MPFLPASVKFPKPFCTEAWRSELAGEGYRREHWWVKKRVRETCGFAKSGHCQYSVFKSKRRRNARIRRI